MVELFQRNKIEVSNATRETREVGLNALANQFNLVVSEYGLEALQQMLAKMQEAVHEQRKIDSDELERVLEEREPHSIIQERVLRGLEKRGIVERVGEELVIDVDRLFLLPLSIIKGLISGTGSGADSYNPFGSSLIEVLGNVFRGKEVRLKNQNGDLSERMPLFYLPESTKDALDLEKIRQAKFHMGLWEIKSRIRISDDGLTKLLQPSERGGVSYLESTIPALLYHPKYGNGYRDQSHVLHVRTPESYGSETRESQYVKFNRHWLHQRGLAFAEGNNTAIIARDTLSILSRSAPNLLESGLLEVRDIESRMSVKDPYVDRKVNNQGFVRMFGNAYYIGKDLPQNTSVRMEMVDNNVSALVLVDDEGRGRVVKLFNVPQRGDAGMKSYSTGKSFSFVAGVDGTAPRRIDELKGKDIELYERARRLVEFDNRLRDANFSIYELPEAELNHLRSFSHLIDTNAIDRLREIDIALVAGIVSGLVDNSILLNYAVDVLERSNGHLLLQDLDELRSLVILRVGLLRGYEQQLMNGEINHAEYKSAIFEANRRVSTLLAALDDKVIIMQARTLGMNEQMLKVAARPSVEGRIFKELFRQAFKGVEGVAFEQLHGLSLELESSGRVSDQDKEEMARILKLNWLEKGEEVSRLVLGELENGFRKPGTRFYILKRHGTIVAFVRFDQDETHGNGHLHVGSLNVRRDLRSSSIGEVMMNETILEEAKDHVLHAQASATDKVSATYAEKLGVIYTDLIVEELNGNKSYWFEFLLDKGLNQSLKTKSTDIQELLRSDVERYIVHLGGENHPLEALMRKLKLERKAITRIFIDPRDSNLRTFIVEKLPDSTDTQTIVAENP